MRVAVMQPYLFPYIGYFQLINAVDKFVILDDVNYINKGWINRNKLLINGEAKLFTVPLEKASQNKLIKDIKIASDSKWISKTLKTIEAGYKKAPYFDQAYPLINEVLCSDERYISKLIHFSLLSILKYMDVSTEVIPSSTAFESHHLKGQDRILDICTKVQAKQYVNPIGGMDLYNKEAFEQRSLRLNFIRPIFTEYKQYASGFVGGLSVVDVLMYNSKDEIAKLLLNYSLE